MKKNYEPAFDFWHPVALANELRSQPLAVSLLGEKLVVFRDGMGGLGATLDECIHRGARLSHGKVVNGRLECPYHRWNYDTAARVHSPSLPMARLRAVCFDVKEHAGAIWLRRSGSTSAFPSLVDSNVTLLTTVRREIKAPVELLLDNFTEVEHWHTVHQNLGYALSDIDKITFELDDNGDSVHVVVTGPQKPIPRPLELLIGVKSGAPFVEEWTTYFKPIYTVYRHWWKNAASGEQCGDTMHFANFFVPLDGDRTNLFVFSFLTSHRWNRPILRGMYRSLMRQVIRAEIDLDRAVVEAQAERGPGLKGLRLGPLDRAIVANRKKIDRIYRTGGRPESDPSHENDASVALAGLSAR